MSDEFCVAVTGGRDYDDEAVVFAALDELGPTRIVEGGQTGADALARKWATLRGVPCKTYEVTEKQYELLGGRAFDLRNQRMLEVERPDLLAAFPGNKGTTNCRKHALRLGIPIRHFGVRDEK